MTDHELDQAKAFIAQEGSAVAKVADQLDESFLALVEEILSTTGKVIVTGAGTSGAIARRMAHLLNVSGTPAFYQNPTDGLHGSLAVAVSGDLLIALSKGGESTELTDLARRVKDRGARTCAVTAARDSSLARGCDLVALVDSDSADPGGIIAMGSTLATAAWGDALAMVLMARRGYSWERVLHSHPGGAVGKNADALLDRVSGA